MSTHAARDAHPALGARARRRHAAADRRSPASVWPSCSSSSPRSRCSASSTSWRAREARLSPPANPLAAAEGAAPAARAAPAGASGARTCASCATRESDHARPLRLGRPRAPASCASRSSAPSICSLRRRRRRPSRSRRPQARPACRCDAGIAASRCAALALVRCRTLRRRRAAGDGARRPTLREVGIDQRLDSRCRSTCAFRDETGAPVTLGSLLRGKPVILSLAYYECPMLCTLVLNGLVSALQALPFDAGKEFDVVTVSFDPTRHARARGGRRRRPTSSEYRRPGAAARAGTSSPATRRRSSARRRRSASATATTRAASSSRTPPASWC